MPSPASTASRCTRRARPSRRTRCASAPAPSCCARRRSAPGCSPPTMPPPTDGAISEAATAAIEALLERALQRPGAVGGRVPPALRRARRRRYATGERVRVRHILFAVTPGVDVVALRKRAEATLLDVRCHDGKAGDALRRRRAHAVQLPERRRRRRAGRLIADGLRAGVRARDLRQARGRRAAAARAQPLRAARGRGAGARAGRDARRSKRCGAPSRCRCASRASSPHCASTCSCWPARRRWRASISSAPPRRSCSRTGRANSGSCG